MSNQSAPTTPAPGLIKLSYAQRLPDEQVQELEEIIRQAGLDIQERRRYEEGPRPRGFAPPPAARRGGYLPDNYRGGVVNDYRRYRLRPPPMGYNWVRVGDGFALVSEDGRIFDVVPD